MGRKTGGLRRLEKRFVLFLLHSRSSKTEGRCDSLDRPDNGWNLNLNSSSTCATIYQFGCNVGYNLTGSEYRQCPKKAVIESEKDLGWNGTEAHCQSRQRERFSLRV